MNFFEDVFNKLFPQKNNQNYPYTLLNEELKRSEKVELSYQKWLDVEQQIDLLKVIQNALAFRKQGIINTIKTHLFHSKYANGFALTYTQDFSKDDFLFIFEYFKHQVLSLGYDLNLKQRTLTDFKEYIETKEKYYLKLRKISRYSEYPLPQLYGNVLLEHILIDDQPSYIKVLTTIYQDSMFEPPENYQDFLNILFE